MIQISLLQGKMLFFELFVDNFILNKNRTKVLNFIFSNSTTSWSSKTKKPYVVAVRSGAEHYGLVDISYDGTRRQRRYKSEES